MIVLCNGPITGARLQPAVRLQHYRFNKSKISKIHICYLPAERSVLGKTVPEVLSSARGRRPRAVLKTGGTVFPNTNRRRAANNVFIIFFRRVLCKQFLY